MEHTLETTLTNICASEFPYGNVVYTKFNKLYLDSIRRNPEIVQVIEDELLSLTQRLFSIDKDIISQKACKCEDYAKLQETRTSILMARTNLENLVNAVLNNISEWYKMKKVV